MNDQQDSIRIRLAGEPGVRYGTEPLTFGVPFAEGALPSGAKLRCVTADGRDLPLQTAEVTTWKPDLKHVKWLLADVQADPARDGETVWLETLPSSGQSGQQGQSGPLAASPAISATSADGLLTIDTGALRLTLRTDFPRWKQREWESPFVGCAVRAADGAWRETLQGPGILLYMKDQHGNLYTSLGCCPAPRVVIEEQGPLRVCVLVTGYLMSEQGVRFCPYRLRLHLYAGKADLRIFHTFIFDQDPTRIELKAIGIKVCMKPGDGAVGAVGGSQALSQTLSKREADKAPGKACDKDEAAPLSLLQSDDLHYTARRDDAVCGAGEKAPGWASLGGADAGVIAAVRDFWQEYPKGLAVTRDALDVRIWPEDTPHPLRFITPFDEPPIWFNGTRDEEEIKRMLAERPTAPIALKSFVIKTLDDIRWVEDVMERLAPGRTKSYCDFMGCSTGVGAAKTTEIVLRFTAGPVADADAAAFAAAVQEPLVGIVDPGYLCDTRALGHFLPAGHPFFADTDRHLTEVYEKTLREPLARCRRYGMFLHGHMVNGHTMWGGPPSGDLVYHFYKNTEPEKAPRYVGPFNNESHDQALGVWGQFLRTGDQRDLRQAQWTSRAVADVSFVHADPGDQANVGCIHYHGAHVWSNTLSRSHSEVGAIMTDYYLTGNRRLRDVAIEAAEGILYDKLEPCGIVNCFAALYREFTGPLSVLLEAYQLTWHEKYGDPARRSLNWLLRAVRTPGWLPISVYTRGPRGAEAVVEPDIPPGEGATNTYHVFEPALRLFPSRALREFLIGFAEYKCRAPVGNVSIPNLCLAYDATGNPEYAAAALAMVPRPGCEMEKTTDCASATLNAPPDKARIRCFYDFIACDLTPRLMWIVAQAMEKDPEGFLEFARKWREAREAMPCEPPKPAGEQKPETSLGVLSTEPFAEQGWGS